VKDRKLATRYARALLSLLDPAAAESCDSFLNGLRQALEQSRDLRDGLFDPAVSLSRRKATLTELARQMGQPPHVVNFLAVVTDHNRLTALPTIAHVFHEERERASGIVPVEVATSLPLGPELEARTLQAMQKLTKGRVRLTYKLDPTLLGGAVTRVGSIVYDGSLRTQLARLRQDMTQE
jgi:F-type H+-transporting ATPase subunit delta